MVRQTLKEVLQEEVKFAKGHWARMRKNVRDFGPKGVFFAMAYSLLTMSDVARSIYNGGTRRDALRYIYDDEYFWNKYLRKDL